MTIERTTELFEDWTRVRRTETKLCKLLVKEEDRYETYRRVRANERDRMVCIRIPASSPLWATTKQEILARREWMR